MRDLTGKSLGEYSILGRLGQGAMGTVYRATHRKTKTAVAIKVLSVSEDQESHKYAARFEREIKILSQFKHPHIVGIHEASEHEGIRFYAMELVDGRSLEERLDESVRLAPRLAVEYTIQICAALEEIHTRGVIHRDLKPANIMIAANDVVKLTDFGIAKDIRALQNTQLTKADHTVGTVAYMSPEQMAGEELTNRSDLYSLGIILYQMFTGRLPFIADSIFEYMSQRMAGSFALPSAVVRGIPTEVDRLVKQLLAQEPPDRPGAARIVADRLRRLAPLCASEEAISSAETMAETADFQVADLRSGRKPGLSTGPGVNKKADLPPSPQEAGAYRSAILLSVALIACLSLGVYMMQPPSAESLFATGKSLMASDDPHYWQVADERYFDPLLKQYPDSPRRAEIEIYRDQIALEQARRQANVQLRTGPNTDPGLAEGDVVKAYRMEKLANENWTAQAYYQFVVWRFSGEPEQRGWVLLAKERLNDDKIAGRTEPDEAKKKIAAAAVAEIKRLFAQEEKAKALRWRNELVENLKDDPKVQDIVEEAKGIF